MRIFIVRHGESYGNLQGRIASVTDLPLTEKGIRQAEITKEALGRLLKADSINYVFSSTLIRARQTADIIVGNDVGIVESDNLVEMNLGILEGLTFSEKEEKYPQYNMGPALSTITVPKGEGFQDVLLRCMNFINEYLTPELANSNILIVTHGITKRVLINGLLNRPNEHVDYINWCDNCSFSEIEYDVTSKSGRLVSLNERDHLSEHRLGADNFHHYAYFAKKDYMEIIS